MTSKSNTLGIVHQPQFMIIPLNTVQKYSCTGIAQVMDWTINKKAKHKAKGFHAGATIRDEINPNLRTSELAVLGNNVTNNSMIVNPRPEGYGSRFVVHSFIRSVNRATESSAHFFAPVKV